MFFEIKRVYYFDFLFFYVYLNSFSCDCFKIIYLWNVNWKFFCFFTNAFCDGVFWILFQCCCNSYNFLFIKTRLQRYDSCYFKFFYCESSWLMKVRRVNKLSRWKQCWNENIAEPLVKESSPELLWWEYQEIFYGSLQSSFSDGRVRYAQLRGSCCVAKGLVLYVDATWFVKL